MNVPDFELAEAHRYFSANCFNRTWDYLEQSERSADDDQQMVLAAMASLWHWTQRGDCTEMNLSIGYWQAARVFAVLRQAAAAAYFAQASLRYSVTLPAFYRGYAHEALARAAMVAADRPQMEQHLAQAQVCLAEITDAEEQAALAADLETIG